MGDSLLKTPLNDWHIEHGGRMVDFAGWSMPVQYESIVDEHVATRTAATVFDVSHMGRLRIEGVDAGRFLDGLLTRRVDDLAPGRVRYSLVTNPQGGILDDILAYRIATPSGRQHYMLVVNASNREKIVDWLQSQLAEFLKQGGDVEIFDRTRQTAMIAVQGPAARKVVNKLVNTDLDRMGYYHAAVVQQFGRPCIISRTGYTGEDGFELIVRSDEAVDVMNNVFRAGRDYGIRPAGLGSRDTLRLEAAMPLYGHELSESINPLQAGLGFAVNLTNRNFVGREAIMQAKENGSLPKRVGLEVEGRRAAREHYGVFSDEGQVGEVTSGAFTPTLQKAIAMAYVRPELAKPGTELEVDIRGRRQPARVVKMPFYIRKK